MLQSIHWFDSWGHVDWGNAPGWVAAIGTTGALFTTVYIVQHDRRIAEEAQARLIQVWPEWMINPEWPDGGELYYGLVLHFRNNSSAAITQVRVAKVGPDGTWSYSSDQDDWDLVRSGEEKNSHILEFRDTEQRDMKAF